MALFDKFNPSTEPSQPRIAAHQFAGGINLLADGDITRGQFDAALGLEASDDAQMDDLVALYNAKATAVLKLAFLVKIHSTIMLQEQGMITDVQSKNFLGVTA